MVPVVEKASIDEAFMDVTDMAKQRLAQTDPANQDTKAFGITSKDNADENATEGEDSVQAFPLTEVERLLCIGAVISREIRQAVYSKLGFTCSTGIANNKLLAKLASPLNKPNGQVVVAPRFVSDLMKSLPMRKVRGLGGKLGKQLESIYESLYPVGARGSDKGEEVFQKLSAHAFLQRCGLAELSKHVGQDTAAYVHQICQGNDGGEPVEEKKVLVKMFSCVKQFDQRSGSALVRVDQLEYWVRLLCEEMIMRCEDERIENKRFPSQVTIQFTRAKVGDKPRTQKLGIAQDTTVDALFAAAMKVMRLHLDSMFPLAGLSMHAKHFHDLDSQAVSTISSFFSRNPEQTASADLTAQRMEQEVKQLAAKRSRESAASPARKSSKQKISAFFGPPSSSSSSSRNNCSDVIAVAALAASGPEATSTCAQAASRAPSHFCQRCGREVAEPEAEHADFHFALQLSQVQRSEAARPAKRKQQGPLDAFLRVGYFQAKDVSCVDLRLLAKVPKPLSAERIYEEFQGRITRDDALVLSLKAKQTYRQLQVFCEQHAEAISFISTNAAYGDQYTRALASLLDPSFSDATKRLKDASGKELKRLKEMAVSAKMMLESDLLEGKDSAAFFAKAANVLSQLKNSGEVKNLHSSLREKANAELTSARQRLLSRGSSSSLPTSSQEEKKLVLSQVLQVLESKMNAEKPRLNALKESLEHQTLQSEVLAKMQQHESDLMKAQETIARLEQMASKKLGVSSMTDLDPSTLAQKAEELLPKLSSKAEVLVHASEKYWLQMQQTSHGQTLMKKAKELVQSVENPDEFCDNVTKAIAEVKLDKLAEWGSTMSKNREKRQEFVNRMKDHCLDFFTSVLPTLKIDTISGVEDDIGYSISKLDLSNFRVKKERVKVRMGTVVDEELFTVRATHLTALLKGFDWTFEQKYFPYLHGGGVADAALSGGVISLGFKAEKKVVNKETGEFKPILVLNSMTIEIRQELKLTVQGSWFSAVYNMLTSLFAELIREYLAKTMESKLLKHMIKLLGTLNKQMDEYWPLIFQLLDIRMEDLPTASPWRGAKEVEIQPQELECTFTERNTVPFTFAKGVLNKYVVVSRILDIDASASKEELDDHHDFHLTGDLKRVPVGSSVLAINGLCCSKLTVEELRSLLDTLPLPITMRFSLLPEDPAKNRRQQLKPQPDFTTFTFRQDGPFGLRLRARPLASCGVIVVGFSAKPDGTKCPAELSGKIRVGQLLTKVNNTDLRFKTLSEVLNILRHLKARPVTMQFATSPDAIIKLRDWPPMIEMEDASSFACDEDDPPSTGRKYVVLSAFARVPSFAQRSHLIEKGDVLLSVNDIPLTGPDYSSFADIMEALRDIANKKEPMRAVFVGREDYIALRKQIQQHRVSDSNRTSIVREDQVKEGIATDDDEETEESNEAGDASSASLIGDKNVDILSSTPTKEIVFPKAPLGILFGNWKDEAIYIRAFISSPGPAEKTGLLRSGQAILQVCGHAVPREATPGAIEEMIMKVTMEAKTQDDSSSDDTASDSKRDKKMKYTLTVRDLELEQELMK
ncbi:unnamed protein product [Phytophthora lilii]|uniref:Unnamed protein product n=1 Tax=Phytophthora lilii TaxID=2077276 RepID=A0A9W6XAR2_9STRA|nr:unnamed protein product [Phytophthora lilii]